MSVLKIFSKFRMRLFKYDTTLEILSRHDATTATDFNFTELLTNRAYDLHRLTEAPVTKELTKEEALHFLYYMYLIRKMENALATLYKAKLARGFCHLYVGQEACAVGMYSVIRPQDSIITSYRCHAFPVLVEKDPKVGIKEVIAELMGRVTGNVRGKGGSMHIYGNRFFGGNGIVGAHVPVGTGIGYKHFYTNDGGISFTIFGDGALNNGQVHEAFNFAKLHNLPVIYIIENNKYGLGTSIERCSANTNSYTRGDLIPGIRTSGMEVGNVRDATKYAVDYVTSGKGPIIVEFVTYRYFGHSMSDPGVAYRTREEVSKVREAVDPIKLLRDNINSNKLATEDEINNIDKDTKKIVDDIVEECKKDAFPPASETTADVYAKYTGPVRVPGHNKFQAHVLINKTSFNLNRPPSKLEEAGR